MFTHCVRRRLSIVIIGVVNTEGDFGFFPDPRYFRELYVGPHGSPIEVVLILTVCIANDTTEHFILLLYRIRQKLPGYATNLSSECILPTMTVLW